jgi:hypothetical protein
MSRFAIDPPDDDKYEPKPVEDIDVPDFDQPDPPPTQGDKARAQALLRRWAESDIPTPVVPPDGTYPDGTPNLRTVVDPAEHAAHALIDVVDTFQKEIASASTLERAHQLRKMLKRAWADVTRLCDNAGDKVDLFVHKLS